MTENEVVGQHHQINGREFEQTDGDSEGQGSLACSSSWCCRESDATEQASNFCINQLKVNYANNLNR